MVTQRNGQIDQCATTAEMDVQQASTMIVRIEKKMSGRLGWTLENVRPKVARALGISIETVSNIRRQRRKSIPGFLIEAIERLLIHELQVEIQGLQHELDVHRQIGTDHRERAFAQAEAALAAARKVLEEAAGAGRTRT